MASISQSVGEGGVNLDADVKTVQALVNARAAALGVAPLPVDGKNSPALVAAIRRCQTQLMRLPEGDGRVDPGGRTFRVLSGTEAAAPPANLSGAAWWVANQAKFPNSEDLATLDPSFRDKASAFVAALRKAGANVVVRSTRRHKVRAYLMHYSWKIAKGVVKAAQVPPEPGCDIVWDHGSDAQSRRAAQEMVDKIGVVFQPSLNSQHIPGLAIDLSISWTGKITILNAAGQPVVLTTPTDGNANPTLHQVGASYKVIKMVADPPHWSIDGH